MSALGQAIIETILMTGVSTLIAVLLGFPLGVLLHYTGKRGLKPTRWLNLILGFVTNVFRSVPCLLLIIIFIPVTNILFGKGSWSGHWYSMIVPLVAASFAYVARVVEQSLSEVPTGVIEAVRSLGISDRKIILHVLIPESKPSLISSLAVVIVSIIGYTSFAGYIAAGGLIVQAFNFGYYGTDKTSMWYCVLLVVLIVQVIQECGLLIAKKIDKRRFLK